MQNEEEIVQEEETLVQTGPDALVELYDLEEYEGEVETHYWVPDKSQPQKKIRLDLRIQALKGSDENIVRRKANESTLRGQQINYEQQQLQRLKPPREIARLEEQLSNISRFDFDGDEAQADKKRDEIERQIKILNDQYMADYAKQESKVRELINQPSFYEVLRSELFVKVIADHSIGFHGRKINFNSSDTENEPPDSFAAGLQEFIFEVLRRGKQKRKNGSSRK
jgi:hypothetical protein